jgi:hypothetical protein
LAYCTVFSDLVHPNLGGTLLVVRVWPEGTSLGGKRGRLYGLDIFFGTIAGLVQVIQETTNLLNTLLVVRFPEK